MYLLLGRRDMRSFEFYNPTRIIFGWNSLREKGHHIAGIGKKPLLVTGRSAARKLGYLDTLEDVLKEKGMDYEIHEGVEPNPRSTTVDAGAELAREGGCDFVLALGGGSVMDAAKGMAISAFSGNSIWSYIYDGENSPEQVEGALPLVTIPTVAATGSEADSVAVITNWEKKVKNSVYSPSLFPQLSIVDPSLTTTLPPHVMGEGGVDIICHVLEPYFNSREEGHLVQRGFVESIVRSVIHNLPIALEDSQDRNSRMNLSWASTLALSQFPSAGLGGGYWMHALEHVLSAHYDIAHARGLAAILPAYMTFVSEEHPEPFYLLARNVFGVEGGDRKGAIKKGIDELLLWLEKVGMRTSLAALGIDDSGFSDIAEEILMIKTRGKEHLPGFKSLNKEGITAILENCL